MTELALYSSTYHTPLVGCASFVWKIYHGHKGFKLIRFVEDNELSIQTTLCIHETAAQCAECIHTREMAALMALEGRSGCYHAKEET